MKIPIVLSELERIDDTRQRKLVASFLASAVLAAFAFFANTPGKLDTKNVELSLVKQFCRVECIVRR